MIAARIPVYAVRLNALLALTLGIGFLLASFYLWMRLHTHLPVQDILRLIPLVQRVLEHGFFSEPLGEWLAPHAAAHRIAITRLLMVIDYRHFGGQNHVLYAASWLSIFTITLVFARTFRQTYQSETALLVFTVGLTLLFLSSPTLMWNLVLPINSSWFVSFAASTLAIYLIVKHAEAPSSLNVVAALLLTVVAALSNFSGVIIWLLLPVLIALRSTRAGLFAALIAGVLLMLYLHGITTDLATFSGDSKDANALAPTFTEKLTFIVVARLAQAATIFSKTCLYLGAPLSTVRPQLATLLVLFSFGLLSAGWLTVLRRRRAGRQQHNAWLELTLSIATLALGVAIATQMGRIRLAAPTDPRYQTVVMMYWLCICGLILFFCLNGRKQKSAWQAAATAACLCIAALMLHSSYPLTRPAKMADAANQASALARLGFSDGIVHDSLLPRNTSPGVFTGLDPFFRESRTAYWSGVNSHLEVESFAECGHVNLSVKPSKWPAISVVRGQIADRWSKGYRQIPISTLQGEVIGFLAPVLAANATSKSIMLGLDGDWEGYLPSDQILHRDIVLHYRSSLLSRDPCRIKM